MKEVEANYPGSTRLTRHLPQGSRGEPRKLTPLPETQQQATEDPPQSLLVRGVSGVLSPRGEG